MELKAGQEYIIKVPKEKDKQTLFGGLDGVRITITEVGKDYFKFKSEDGAGFLFNSHISWLEPAKDLCGCDIRTLMIRGCLCGGE